MSLLEAFACKLSNYEGPLDALLYLVQQGELALEEIPLQLITRQFIDVKETSALEVGAEFISVASTLVWLKSQKLLASGALTQEEENFDPLEVNGAILQQLVDYCVLKKGADYLTQKEEHQQAYHRRGQQPMEELSAPFTIEATLAELSALFCSALERASRSPKTIIKDEWQVSHAIAKVRELIRTKKKIDLADLFLEGMCRGEVIVTFLALLELIKKGEIRFDRGALAGGKKGEGDE